METSKPDVQLGKIFIVLWIGFMLFIIISIIVVYFNAKNETSSCEAAVINVENSNKPSSMSRTTKLFIAFLAITAFAVSTMNLTYKINYFEKKTVEPKKTVQNLLNMMKKNQTIGSSQISPNYSVNNNESSVEQTATITSGTEQSN